MKQRLTSVGVLSVAKISALVYGAIALIFLPFCIAFLVAATISGHTNLGVGAPVAIGIAVLAPLFYAAMGFVVGAIGAAIYNLFARWIGGIEIELTPAGGAASAASGH